MKIKVHFANFAKPVIISHFSREKKTIIFDFYTNSVAIRSPLKNILNIRMFNLHHHFNILILLSLLMHAYFTIFDTFCSFPVIIALCRGRHARTAGTTVALLARGSYNTVQ